MPMSINEQPIAIFDSGVGGISVLREIISLLPNENYIYFGDSKNAPYGVKSVEEINRLTIDGVEYLMQMKAKAIVIACNTATAAAIIDLREIYKEIPVVGIEPAVKPAVIACPKGRVLVMATSMTILQEKFNNLMDQYKDQAEILPLPCPGIVEYVEEDRIETEEFYKFMEELLKPYKENPVDAVVFGCTHYPFIKKVVSDILGDDVKLLDGSVGVARELKHQLEDRALLNLQDKKGQLVILNSSENPEEVKLCYRLLERE